MAQLKDILETERLRADMAQCLRINLFKEGTFYRAYEWSAWLCVRYVHEFKTTRRLMKNTDESMVFIGFPVTSLQKFFGDDVAVNDDGSVSVSLRSDVFGEGSSADTLAVEFSNWKQSVPLTENSKKRLDEERNPATAGPQRLTDIMHDILSYPIESRTPMESMSFLSELKTRLSKII